MPAMHASPALQIVPHAPQFASSLAVSTQPPPQPVVPPGQLSMHTPEAHTLPAVQLTAQPPQCPGSTVRSLHAPSQKA